MVRLQEHDDAEVEEIYDDYRCTTFLLVPRLQHQLGDQPELGCCLGTDWLIYCPAAPAPNFCLGCGASLTCCNALTCVAKTNCIMVGCRPARVTEGKPHPDPIVETACLANVLPPVPTYRHHIGPCVAAGMLSDAQIETVIYANQRFELPPLADGAPCSSLVAEMMCCFQCLRVALSTV